MNQVLRCTKFVAVSLAFVLMPFFNSSRACENLAQASSYSTKSDLRTEVRECQYDADCDWRERCQYGRCVFDPNKCMSNADCGPQGKCIGGICN